MGSMSENEIKPVAFQWQDEVGKWNPVQYEKAMQRGANGYKVRALFDQHAIYRLMAERDAAVADAARWQELCRKIDAGTFPSIVIDDAMAMGAGALELQVDAALAQEVTHAG